MSTWTLPWHYLSSTVALTQGHVVGGQNLIGHLLALKAANEEKFCEAIAPDQMWDDPDGLFAHVRTLSMGHSKPGYAWPAGSTGALRLKLRMGFNRADAILTPDALILPWPFKGDTSNPPQLEQAREEAACPPIPTLNDLVEDFDPTTGLYLNAFMLAADDAVEPGSSKRPDFEDIKEDCAVFSPHASKAKLIEWAKRDHGYPKPGYPAEYPDNLVVCVKDSISTRETEWESDGARLLLRLGWTENTEPCLGIDPFPIGMSAIEIDAWPNGWECTS